MLTLSKEHLLRDGYTNASVSDLDVSCGHVKVSPYTNGFTRYFPTTRRLLEFSNLGKEPKPTDKVIYVDGTFDFFRKQRITNEALYSKKIFL